MLSSSICGSENLNTLMTSASAPSRSPLGARPQPLAKECFCCGDPCCWRGLRIVGYTRQDLDSHRRMLASKIANIADALRHLWSALGIRTRHSLGPPRRRVRVTIRFFGGRRCVFVIGHCVSFLFVGFPRGFDSSGGHVRPMFRLGQTGEVFRRRSGRTASRVSAKFNWMLERELTVRALLPRSAIIGGDRQVSCQKEVWMSAGQCPLMTHSGHLRRARACPIQRHVRTQSNTEMGARWR